MITSSAAILAVYAVGFVRTKAAADRVTAAASQFHASPTDQTVVATQPVAVPTATTSDDSRATSNGDDDDERPALPTPVPAPDTSTSAGIAPSSSPTPVAVVAPTQAPAPTATAVPSTASRYRDGTYSGTGMSRHGDIAAQVTVKSGKIVSTQITGCFTRYPCSRIADLPGEVIGQQTTDVDMVSGATDSSEAFLQAVDNALKKALG